MKNYKARAIIYTRVSSEGQVENTSLKQQEDICTAFCERNEYEIIKIYTEKGESAKYIDRTELKQALKFCSNKKNAVDFFVVYKLDRFSRNLENHLVLKTFLSKQNVSLTSATEQLADTPVGRFTENLLASTAQFENEVRTERVIGGIRSKLFNGEWIFQAPIGYIKDRTREYKLKGIIPHPDYFKPLQEAWKMYASGRYTITEMCDFLKKAGVKTHNGIDIEVKTLSKIFRNHFYRGVVFCDSQKIEAKGKHTPMIDDVTFYKVQEVLQGNVERINQTGKLDTIEDFLLSKCIHCCSCGNLLSGSYSKGKRKYYGYYQCSNSKCEKRQFLPKDKMHEQFIKFLESIKPPKEDLELFLEVIVDEYQNLYDYAIDSNKRIAKEIADIEKKLTTLKDLLEDGTYSREEYNERKRKHEQDIAVKKISLNETNLDIPELESCIIDAKRFLEHLPTFWINLSHGQKRKMTEFLFPKGLIWDGKEYRTPEIHPIFNTIEDVLEEKNQMVDLRGIEPLTSSMRMKCSSQIKLQAHYAIRNFKFLMA